MIDRRKHAVRAIGWLLLMLFACAAQAHEFTLDAVMNAFIKVERDEAHLVVRAPLYLFRAMRFPVKGIEVDIDNSAASMERALAALQQDVVVIEDGRPLKARQAGGRLSLPSDRSFESYQSAAEHVATRIEAGTSIVIDQGYVDAHLIYPITSPNAVFAVRTAVGAEIGLKLALRFIGPSGESRALLIRSGSGAHLCQEQEYSQAATFSRKAGRHKVQFSAS